MAFSEVLVELKAFWMKPNLQLPQQRNSFIKDTAKVSSLNVKSLTVARDSGCRLRVFAFPEMLSHTELGHMNP